MTCNLLQEDLQNANKDICEFELKKMKNSMINEMHWCHCIICIIRPQSITCFLSSPSHCCDRQNCVLFLWSHCCDRQSWQNFVHIFIILMWSSELFHIVLRLMWSSELCTDCDPIDVIIRTAFTLWSDLLVWSSELCVHIVITFMWSAELCLHWAQIDMMVRTSFAYSN